MGRSKHGRKIAKVRLPCPYCGRTHSTRASCMVGFAGASYREPEPIRTYPAKKKPCGCGG